MRRSAETPLRWQNYSVWHKRRHRAIQRVGNGAEQFGFAFLNHAIGADGVDAGFNQILFDDRHGLREAVERGVNLVHAALFAWQQSPDRPSGARR